MTPNESARQAALEALSGHDPTGGALYFFLTLANPPIASCTAGPHRQPSASIGLQIKDTARRQYLSLNGAPRLVLHNSGCISGDYNLFVRCHNKDSNFGIGRGNV